MRFRVGVTDKARFGQLQAMGPAEVNFRQPSSTPLARFLQPGVALSGAGTRIGIGRCAAAA